MTDDLTGASPARTAPRRRWYGRLSGDRRPGAAARVVMPVSVAAAALVAAAPARAQRTPADTAGQGAIAAAAAHARELVVDDPGPGIAGRTLAAVLDRPHVVLISPDTGLTLGRDVHVDRALVVNHGPLRLAGRVEGDVVVFGDLFLRPGAQVTGRVIAIGGGVYGSALALVRGEVLAYRDLAVAQRTTETRITVAISRAAAVPGPRVTLPGVVGFRVPTYDRIDGLSAPLGPEFVLDTGRVRVDPTVTYRSHLGAFDPAVRAHAELGRRIVVDASAERATLTNDRWIRGDFTSSLSMLGSGEDVRNYYRATRVDATVGSRYELGAGVFEPYVGGLTEEASSVARDTGSNSYPWSFLSHRSLEGSRRANPAVTGGRITSALAGARFAFESPRVVGRAGARVEQALDVARGARFTQVTVDAALALPTNDEHLFEFLAHGVATSGGAGVPTQRYAYLGGSGTLPSLFLLAEGGTELAWAEARYTVPVRVIRVPFGVPTITARAMAGSAGVNTLPAFTPNLGLRAAVSIVRADFVFDPRGRGRRVFTLGVGLR
ncbi:hypothetical protein tb265_38630 [Gemmatimonadetes bacterium T265]|nr:hypothetical protein tb265_38630 [Gemmatimonadetes bacterium T265]